MVTYTVVYETTNKTEHVTWKSGGKKYLQWALQATLFIIQYNTIQYFIYTHNMYVCINVKQ